MKASKLFLPLLFSLCLSLVIIGITFHSPTEAQAGPLAGFTPSPPTNPPDNHDDDDDNPPSSPPKETLPPDYVLVQMSQCDMTCAAGTAQKSQPIYEPLVYSVNPTSDAPTFGPIFNVVAVEIIAPVRLVHQGSGFIAIGTLSTQHSTRVSVPYPGQWEVFLTGSPQFMSEQAQDITGTNLAQLQANLASEPISLGLVEANTESSQVVKCPIECVLPAAPPAVPGQYLPETGHDLLAPVIFLFISGLVLVIAGCAARLANQSKTAK